MAKRDPQKTRRNKIVAKLKGEIDTLVPKVLSATGYDGIQSLNAKYVGKVGEYIDLLNTVIDSPEQFIAHYLRGFQKKLKDSKPTATCFKQYLDTVNYPVVWEWLQKALTRTYLERYDQLSRIRPEQSQAFFWVGQKNADYGLFITPRFKKGEWENDKSEIRKFKQKYWTIGHICYTGLVIPNKEEVVSFQSPSEYLKFFKYTMVRNSGSAHELAIAEKYSDYVLSSDTPEEIPLLIPELRYAGKTEPHEHRLDFLVINPFDQSKVGFEVSPFSTHAKVDKISDMTLSDVNEIAQKKYEKDAKKRRKYFLKYGITTIDLTDSILVNYDSAFSIVKKYLKVAAPPKQLLIEAKTEFFQLKDEVNNRINTESEHFSG